MAHIQKIKRKRGIAHQVFYNVDGIRKTKYFPMSIPHREVKKFAKEIEHQSNHKQKNLILNKVTLEEFSQIYAQRRASEVADFWDAFTIPLGICLVFQIGPTLDKNPAIV